MTDYRKALALPAIFGLLGLLAVLAGAAFAPDAGAKPTPTTEPPATTIAPTTTVAPPTCEPAGYDDCAPPTTVRPPNCFDVEPMGPGCIPVPVPEGPVLLPPVGCSLAGPPLGDDVVEDCPAVDDPISARPGLAG